MSSHLVGKQNKVAERPSLKNINARVDRISIDGLGRTKDDFVVKAVDDLFRIRNFQELLTESIEVKTKLESLGCFQSVGINVDTSSGPAATPDYGYQVTFVVEELSKVKGGVHTMVGTNNEPYVVGNCMLPNLLGRGEKIQGELGQGTKQTRQFNLTFSKPLLSKYNASVAGCFFGTFQNWQMSNYNLGENGLALGLDFYSLQNLKHTVQWEGIIREFSVGSRFAPFDIRKDAGSTLKSSIKHILAYDTRRSYLFPSSGILSKLTTEFAGLGGNVGFLKNEALVRLDVPLFSDIVAQASVGGGCLMPFNAENKGISICDNFFLGGPITFRGFATRGACPSKDGSVVGARMYWCAALSLFTPLPFRPGVGGFGDNFRTHFFVNVGNAGSFSIDDGISALLNQARLAYGIGLALRLGQVARLEVNYCFPVWSREGDRPVSGVQIGLGASL